VLLAAVFVRAGAAKLARPAATATSFAALGVPAAGPVARAVPATELLVAAVLLAAPRAGAIGSLALLVPFTAVLARAVARGTRTPCNCFGGARADPISWADVIRNVLLGVLAVAALPASRPVAPERAGAATAAALFVAGYGVLLAIRRRQAR
jgi:uncharacterized membrane protein YphA (DoxX/SURF4 family)